MASRNPSTLMSMSSQDEVFDFLFKIVLIGDCGTGKTCITQVIKLRAVVDLISSSFVSTTIPFNGYLNPFAAI